MLAFIHIPKTGGQTITYSLLRNSFGIHHCDILPMVGENGTAPITPSDIRLAKKAYPFLKSIAGHSVMLHIDHSQEVSDLQYFAFVREPIAQYVSHFNYRRENQNPGLTFEEWLTLDEFHNHQTKMFAGTEDVEAAIREINRKEAFVGLTECFDESLVVFRQLLAPQLRIDYQRRNEASDKRYAEEILARPGVRQRISELCKSDLILYEYVKQQLLPYYRQQYGKTLQDDVAAFMSDNGRVNTMNIVLNRLYRNIIYKPIYWSARRRAYDAAEELSN